MRPVCLITINGAAPSLELSSRILSCRIDDREGAESDTASLVLNNSPPAAVPSLDAVLRIWLGYGAATAYMGAFSIEDIDVGIAPDLMTLTGRAATMQGDAKTPKARNWDDATIASIVHQIAGENGLRAAVDPTIGAYVYDYIAQIDETDYAFLERLARRHGAIFSVKDGTAIFAARGSGMAPSGAALTPIIARRSDLVAGSAAFRISDRVRYKEVVASYDDPALGKRVEVTAPSDPEGTATARIVEPFGTEAEAEAAAKAKAKDLLRSRSTFRASMVGNPAARAGAPITFPDCHPDFAGVVYIVSHASHDFSKGGGYTTGLSGERQ